MRGGASRLNEAVKCSRFPSKGGLAWSEHLSTVIFVQVYVCSREAVGVSEESRQRTQDSFFFPHNFGSSSNACSQDTGNMNEEESTVNTTSCEVYTYVLFVFLYV